MLIMHMLTENVSPAYLVVEICYLGILLQVKHLCYYFGKPWLVPVNQKYTLNLYRKIH